MHYLFVFTFLTLLSFNSFSQRDDFYDEEMEGKYVYERIINMNGLDCVNYRNEIVLNVDGTFKMGDVAPVGDYIMIPKRGKWRMEKNKLILMEVQKNGVYTETEKIRVRFKDYGLPEFKIGKEHFVSEVKIHWDKEGFKPHTQNCVIR